MQRVLKWSGIALFALILLVVGLVIALDRGYLQGPLVRFFAIRTGREIRVEGPTQMRLFSRSPSLVAERVYIGNPPWTPPGASAEIGKVILVFNTTRHGLELASVELESATLHLFRDSTGHANWQQANPDIVAAKALPLVRVLRILDAHVLLDDEYRHLKFDGTVSVDDAQGYAAAAPLRIVGTGRLNGRSVNFEVAGDPLKLASRDKPYQFSFTEHSSGSLFAAKGALLQPFDLQAFDAAIEANGADLKDLYYLIGVTLFNTGPYRLSTEIARRGSSTKFSDLLVTFGQSDIHGGASFDTHRGQSNIEASLNSQMLRLADLGVRAAGREASAEAAPPFLLSDATPNVAALRRIDGTAMYRVRRVDAGRITLDSVTAKVSVDHGALGITLASPQVLQGKLNAQLNIDARNDMPTVQLDLGVSELQVGQYARTAGAAAALEGPLDLQVALTGRGKSLHQVAASANGTIAATLSHGSVRDSLAELTGIDLRGLGLLAAKNKKLVDIRCGVASFEAHDGTLTAKNMLLDTEPVLIMGEGLVHLDSEALDLVLHGRPKSMRLFQLRSPILIRGTLAHPSIGIQSHNASLVIIDRGKARNADCDSLVAHPFASFNP